MLARRIDLQAPLARPRVSPACSPQNRRNYADKTCFESLSRTGTLPRSGLAPAKPRDGRKRPADPAIMVVGTRLLPMVPSGQSLRPLTMLPPPKGNTDITVGKPSIPHSVDHRINNVHQATKDKLKPRLTMGMARGNEKIRCFAQLFSCSLCEIVPESLVKNASRPNDFGGNHI